MGLIHSMDGGVVIFDRRCGKDDVYLRPEGGEDGRLWCDVVGRLRPSLRSAKRSVELASVSRDTIA